MNNSILKKHPALRSVSSGGRGAFDIQQFKVKWRFFPMIHEGTGGFILKGHVKL